MSEPATLSKEGDISTITLDDGKVNVFSLEMLESIQKSLDQVSKDSGALIIRGREGIFSAGFDLKTFQSGDAEKAQKMTALGMKNMHDLYMALYRRNSKLNVQKTLLSLICLKFDFVVDPYVDMFSGV